MDPKTALWLSKSRISELHAEAASNRLASEARKSHAVEKPARVPGSGLPAISRLRSLIGRGAGARRSSPCPDQTAY
jgi:hypothetical protein